jgi:hypothetical protein
METRQSCSRSTTARIAIASGLKKISAFAFRDVSNPRSGADTGEPALQSKRLTRLMVLLFLWAGALLFAQAAHGQQQFELSCPTGTVVITGTATYDQSTGMYRAWQCLNLFTGQVTIQPDSFLGTATSLNVPSVTYPLSFPGPIPVVFNIAGGQGNQLNSKAPMYWIITGEQAQDTTPMFEMQTDQTSAEPCFFSDRMDGDGFNVFYGTCSLALANPLSNFFGGVLITNNQKTANDDFDIGPSSTKTGGAVIARWQDTASTVFFLATDIESVSNPPQFPIGLSAVGGPVKLSHFTVATLPSASTWGAGAIVIVTDATTFTVGTCTGGGSDTMIAVSNGTSWTCH